MTLQIDAQDNGTDYTIKISGEADYTSSPKLRHAIRKAPIRENGTLSVDLSNLNYIDSSGLAALVEGRCQCADNGVRFVLLSPSPSVVKVLEAVRLDSVFDIRSAM